MSALTSAGMISADVTVWLKDISKILMLAAPGAIGLNTNFKILYRAGLRPMVHGFIISLLVAVVALAVEYAVGIAPCGSV